MPYVADDIRLCTMQRASSEEKLGVVLNFHFHERFHFLKLLDDFQLTLAFRAGVKSFDRVIEYNGTNVEADSPEEFARRFDIDRDQPIKLLVCSPATYHYYKQNKKQLHSGLPTVRHLEPVQNVTGKSVEFKMYLFSAFYIRMFTRNR